MEWSDAILFLLWPAIWLRDRVLSWVSDVLWAKVCRVADRLLHDRLPFRLIRKERLEELLDAEAALAAIDAARAEAAAKSSIQTKVVGE